LDLSNCSFIDTKRLNIFRSIVIKNGDVLMALTGGTIGKIIRAENIGEPMLQNYRVGNFFPSTKDLDKIYMFYLLSRQNTMDQINYLINRNGQPNIGKENFKNMTFPLPSFSEQQAIANYLDAKTQAIDKKVSLLEQKIETYKKLKRTLINQTITKGLDKNTPLKDSGISWIGQIPQHWEVKRFKDVLNLFTGNSISDKNGFDYIENSIPYVSTKDIDFNTNEINYTNGMYIPNSDKTFKRAKKGTCLICIEGANAGKKYGILNQEVAFVNKLAALKFIANRNFDKYLYYYIQSNAFSGEFFPLINGLIGG